MLFVTGSSQMKLTLNRQNMRYWSEANPNGVHVEPLHSQGVKAWSGISASGITGPYFCGYCDVRQVCAFGEWVVVPGDTPSWHRTCHQHVLPAVDGHRKNYLNMTWPLAAARGYVMFRCHHSALWWHFLASPFARSLCLLFLFMGYLKSKVLETHPADLHNLKQRSSDAFIVIPPACYFA